VKVTVTGTDDKPVINMAAVATITEQANHTLSLSSDTAHVTLGFVDQDLANTGHTATVLSASATGVTTGILPGSLGTAELMAFFNVDSVVKAAGSSTGTINTTFQAPDLAFDYLAAGEHLNITYVVQLDDHAGGVSTQNVVVTVIGTNDAPIYLCGPETAHLVEGQNLSGGNLHADGDLLFSDIDLSDHHTVSTTVTPVRSGGGSIPLSNAALLAAFHTSVSPDSTNQLLGDVDWNFALANGAASFLAAGETLTLTYHVTVNDGHGGTDVQDVTITILGTNHPVAITSGAQSTSVSELAGTTGSAAVDVAPTSTLNFTDADTGDTHTVAVTLTSTSGPAAPAATQADLTTALAATLHDSTGTGTGSVDLNFAIADHDLDYLAEGQTLTVNYNVKVSDASTNANQTVSVTITGANDDVALTSGPESANVAEQVNTTGSTAPDTATGTLAFADVDLSDTHTVSVALSSAVWSGDPDFVPAGTLNDLQTALATALNDSTGSGSGSIDWTFSIQDKDLDFLSAGETLTATYDVTVFDGFTSSTQTVTITMTGAADNAIAVNPVTASIADTSATDDGQLVAVGNLITDAGDSAGDLANTLHVTDVNGQPVAGSVDVAGAYGTLTVFDDGAYLYFANAGLDAVLLGQNPTEVFNFTVSDDFGHSTATTLTFNVTGANEAPQITAAQAFGSVIEDAGPTTIVNGDFETGDLSGWTPTGGTTAELTAVGGSFGNYAANLSGTLSQDVATTAGQHYTVSFYVAGVGPDAGGPLNVLWDGASILSTSTVGFGFTHYSFDVVGDATNPTTHLEFQGGGDIWLDQVAVGATPGPATETASGSVSFSDVELGDTHTASVVEQGSGYVGTLSLDPVSESGGTGSVAWHYSVDNADIQFLADGQQMTQVYTVFVTDEQGGTAAQDVTISLTGTNDAPTAVNDTVITDVGPNGAVIIAPWALAANDTDPDTIDQVFVNSIGTSTGGTAGGIFGAVFFSDDATLGGSFTYDSSDGIATSNFATATVINNATTTTTLTGTGANEILIATQGNEALNGGGGNDILFGNNGSHVLTGGSGNDTFAFQSQPTGTNVIADFNNLTEQDHIAISANSFGGGMTPGMDTTSLFESSADDQFSGAGPLFHFDTSNQTLYYSADGTQDSVITVVTVQPGVILNAHDLLIV
jgi:VCBS repeat-containing protein